MNANQVRASTAERAQISSTDTGARAQTDTLAATVNDVRTRTTSSFDNFNTTIPYPMFT